VRKDLVGQIAGIFTHVHSKARRLFIVLDLAEGDFQKRGVIEAVLDPSNRCDEVLRTPTFKLAGRRMIIGLPSVSAQHIWVVPAMSPDIFWIIDQDIYVM
jgi:hypothetical protein